MFFKESGYISRVFNFLLEIPRHKAFPLCRFMLFAKRMTLNVLLLYLQRLLFPKSLINLRISGANFEMILCTCLCQLQNELIAPRTIKCIEMIVFVNKDWFIKNRTRTVVTLVLFWFDFLWISLYCVQWNLKWFQIRLFQIQKMWISGLNPFIS